MKVWKCAAVLIAISGLVAISCQSKTRPEASALKTDPKVLADTAAKAKVVLEKYCSECHGSTQANAGFGLADNFDALRVSNFVKPFRPEESRIWDRMVRSKDMPPEDVGDAKMPSNEDRKVVEQWIQQGANGIEKFRRRDFISTPKLLKLIRTDLDKVAPKERQNTRYLTLHKFLNARQQNPDGSITNLFTDDLIETYRKGMVRTLNHLSWAPDLIKPVEVEGSQGMLYRINLYDFNRTIRFGDSGNLNVGLNHDTWEKLAGPKNNPYYIKHPNAMAQEIYQMTNSDAPYTRLDFFVFLATKPPLYFEIMGITPNILDVESALGIDRYDNIRRGKTWRAGFVNSGVSVNNRLIERHVVNNRRLGYESEGYYWISYDFAGNLGRQNLQNFPGGPNFFDYFEGNGFVHDGGEAIFSLPNGMQAYIITNAKDTRIDRAPVAVVSEPRQPEGVLTGISCMNCHVEGIKPKDDQIKSYVSNLYDQSRDAYPRAIVDFTKNVYADKAKADEAYKRDQKRWFDSLSAIDANSKEEPIGALYYHFERTEVGLTLAAAETDLTPDDFLARLGRSNLKSVFSSFFTPGGTVKRGTFKDNFVNIIREFNLALDDASMESTKHVFKTQEFVNNKLATFWKHTFDDTELGLLFTNVLFHSKFEAAKKGCEKLNKPGENAWRLPFPEEFASLVNLSVTEITDSDFYGSLGKRESGFWTVDSVGNPVVIDVRLGRPIDDAPLTSSKLYLCVRSRN